MSGVAWLLLAASTVAALANWTGVIRAPSRSLAGDGTSSPSARPRRGASVDPRTLVYVAKPATLALLIGVALALEPADDAIRACFVVGLVLSLVGDVALMLPRDLFAVGLGAFLAGHVAYVVGMGLDHRSWAWTVVGALVVVAALAVIAPRVVGAVTRRYTALRAPVIAYMGVISAMVVAAFGRTVPVGVVGALLFYTSDATLAWNRFVAEISRGDLAVMVTYHLAQGALVLSLLS